MSTVQGQPQEPVIQSTQAQPAAAPAQTVPTPGGGQALSPAVTIAASHVAETTLQQTQQTAAVTPSASTLAPHVSTSTPQVAGEVAEVEHTILPSGPSSFSPSFAPRTPVSATDEFGSPSVIQTQSQSPTFTPSFSPSFAPRPQIDDEFAGVVFSSSGKTRRLGSDEEAALRNQAATEEAAAKALDATEAAALTQAPKPTSKARNLMAQITACDDELRTTLQQLKEKQQELSHGRTAAAGGHEEEAMALFQKLESDIAQLNKKTSGLLEKRTALYQEADVQQLLKNTIDFAVDNYTKAMTSFQKRNERSGLEYVQNGLKIVANKISKDEKLNSVYLKNLEKEKNELENKLKRTPNDTTLQKQLNEINNKLATAKRFFIMHSCVEQFQRTEGYEKLFSEDTINASQCHAFTGGAPSDFVEVPKGSDYYKRFRFDDMSKYAATSVKGFPLVHANSVSFPNPSVTHIMTQCPETEAGVKDLLRMARDTKSGITALSPPNELDYWTKIPAEGLDLGDGTRVKFSAKPIPQTFAGEIQILEGTFTYVNSAGQPIADTSGNPITRPFWHVVGWKDKTPADRGVLSKLHELRQSAKREYGLSDTQIEHCNAGIGRTAIDVGYSAFREKIETWKTGAKKTQEEILKEADEICLRMRFQRPGAFQTVEQYDSFCKICIAECKKQGVYSPSKDELVEEMRAAVPSAKPEEIEKIDALASIYAKNRLTIDPRDVSIINELAQLAAKYSNKEEDFVAKLPFFRQHFVHPANSSDSNSEIKARHTAYGLDKTHIFFRFGNQGIVVLHPDINTRNPRGTPISSLTRATSCTELEILDYISKNQNIGYSELIDGLTPHTAPPPAPIGGLTFTAPTFQPPQPPSLPTTPVFGGLTFNAPVGTPPSFTAPSFQPSQPSSLPGNPSTPRLTRRDSGADLTIHSSTSQTPTTAPQTPSLPSNAPAAPQTPTQKKSTFSMEGDDNI